MDVGAQVLICTGIALLFVGALSGIPMGLTRLSEGNPPVPRYLIMLHLAGYQQAPILLALGAVFAIVGPDGRASSLGPFVFSAAAGLLVLKELLNWLGGVEDEFVEKSPGLFIGNIFGPIHIVGLILCTIAIVPALL
jgi:hypothetical protein